MKTIKQTLNVLSVLMTLLFLPACEPRDLIAQAPEANLGDAVTTTDPVDEVVTTPPQTETEDLLEVLDFCVSEELRSIYLTPIPVGASALYAALVHAGYPNRKADPKCLTQYAIDLGGYTYIPCTVNSAEGALYGLMWQDADRNWVKAAIEAEAVRQDVVGRLSASIETVDVSSKFYVFSSLQGKRTTVLKLKNDEATFTGLCQ